MRSFYLIILLGTVSLFADITYEGARSILGPYLGMLGATGALIGTVFGFGEFIASFFRILFGKLADYYKKPYLITIIGYSVNLLAVPCMAFVDSFQAVAILICLERFGKAIRTPPRDAILSYATKETGRGFGFGIHQAMDRTGAFLGPLLIALLFSKGFGYKGVFLTLFIPATIALLVLIFSFISFPKPQELEKLSEVSKPSKSFWLYLIAASFVGAGYIDFPLIAFHFSKIHFSQEAVPLFYALTMAVAGLSALFLGRLYDKKGLSMLPVTVIISSFFAPFIFLGNTAMQVIGVILWGIGLGAQDSIMRAVVAQVTGTSKRSTAYGTFQFVFGLSWFLGSALLGFLYDRSPLFLVIISQGLQLLSLPFFYLLLKRA